MSWWLDAARSDTLTVENNAVAQWRSRGKDGTVFTTAHDLPGPTYTRTLAKQNVVSFEGAKNQRLVATGESVNRTIFVVDVPRDLGVSSGLFGIDWKDVGQRYEPWTHLGTWAWQSGEHTFAQGGYIRIDGERFDKNHNLNDQPLIKSVTQILTFEHGFDNGKSVATFTPSIGGYYADNNAAARSFDGDIAEILSFDRILDAVICESDYVAAQLRNTLGAFGLSVPDDVRLAGFDDVRCARVATPPLTTVHQPCEDLARIAYQTLLERLRDPSLPARRILLPAPLVVRASTR